MAGVPHLVVFCHLCLCPSGVVFCLIMQHFGPSKRVFVLPFLLSETIILMHKCSSHCEHALVEGGGVRGTSALKHAAEVKKG